MSLAELAGVDCPAADGLSDETLKARLYRPAVGRSRHQRAPDFGVVHQARKHPGLTVMLLCKAYAGANPLAYKYTSFCVRYRVFSKAQQRSMRQANITGEKLFIDYAGDFVPIVDAATCEITRAKIFVALLPPQMLEDGQGQRRRPRRVRWPRPLLVKVELARCSAGFASTKRRSRQRVAARRRAR